MNGIIYVEDLFNGDLCDFIVIISRINCLIPIRYVNYNYLSKGMLKMRVRSYNIDFSNRIIKILIY